MRRLFSGLAALALATALLPLQGAVGSEALPEGPDRIDLPDGWQPEGITTDGRFLYVGSLADGAIYRASVETGAGRVLATGVAGRVAVGVEYDRCRDLLWVAGGDGADIRAQDADTGRVVATYSFPSATPRFLNDLVVTRRAVYATDSFNAELAVVPLAAPRGGDRDGDGVRGGPCRGDDEQNGDNENRVGGGGEHHGAGDHHSGRGLPPASAATTLPLTGDLQYQAGFNLNGIVKSGGSLLAVQSNTGLLIAIDPATGRTKVVDLGGETVVNGDGLEIDGHILYVGRNNNLVSVVRLSDSLARGKVVAQLRNSGFDVPTTVALARHSLWVVNARFGTPPTPDTAYWITRLDEYTG